MHPRAFALLLSSFVLPHSSFSTQQNILFIISDDLTPTALSCYGNTVSKTPNIDHLATQGTRFTRAFCNATYCGPSRASFMSGYYPHATGVLNYTSPRPAIGDRATWSQHFKNHGYHTARVSKIYHMGVPGGIEDGSDGADDPSSWTETFNSPGPEWKAPGTGETLEGNPDGTRPVVGGNTFVVVEADGDDLVHSDGNTAVKAIELLQKHAQAPFFLAVGFVRPHVPFVAPRQYFAPYLPYDKIPLPPKLEGDWDDIPKAGINYKTSLNMKMASAARKKPSAATMPPSPSWTPKSAKSSTPWKNPVRQTTPSSSSPATTATISASMTSGPKSACATNPPASPSSSKSPAKSPA